MLPIYDYRVYDLDHRFFARRHLCENAILIAQDMASTYAKPLVVYRYNLDTGEKTPLVVVTRRLRPVIL